MTTTEISFHNLTFALPDGRELLRGVTLSLEAQTTTALLGRSGSGKTTLLRTINGLVRPSGGQVLVHGRDVAGSDVIALRRSIGYVIQETGLFPHMTIARNVALSYELAGRGGTAAQTRLEEVLAMTGLPAAEFGLRYPHQLSGGQRQRAGLARALMNDPAILLMDEPFGALDPITRSEMQTMLHDLLRRVRKTVVMVTHDLEEALYLAERVIFLESGSVVADMSAGEVRGSRQAPVLEYLHAIRSTNVPSSPAEASA